MISPHKGFIAAVKVAECGKFEEQWSRIIL